MTLIQPLIRWALRITIWKNNKQSILCYSYSGKRVSPPREHWPWFLNRPLSVSLLLFGCTSQPHACQLAWVRLVVESWTVKYRWCINIPQWALMVGPSEKVSLTWHIWQTGEKGVDLQINAGFCRHSTRCPNKRNGNTHFDLNTHCRVMQLEKARFGKRMRPALYRNRSALMRPEGAAVRLVSCCTNPRKE